MEKYIALVTGGNRGIGYTTCEELARAGCHVILTSRNEADGLEALAKLKSNDSIVFHELDVTEIKDIRETRNWIENKYGRLDILINNAVRFRDFAKKAYGIDFSGPPTPLNENIIDWNEKL